jgi:formyltetrahydrofolate-dependent phosphoribosylglycinamide formyltransferase
MGIAQIVVMASGGGSNLQALMDAVRSRHLHAQIALVVSNRKDAYALTRARDAGLPTLYLPLKPILDSGQTREDYDIALAGMIIEAVGRMPDLIVLAGWMHVLSEAFLEHFPMCVINLHPALPGMFPGTNAIRRAYDAYMRGEIDSSGCMVHYVIPEVDAGPVIAQAVVHLDLGDTLEQFEARMHAAEHQLIVQAVRLALDNQSTDSATEQG